MHILKTLQVLAVVVAIFLGVIVYATTMPTFQRELENSIGFEFDSSILQKHVRVLSEELIPRTCAKPAELQNSANYIREELLKWNTKTYLQTYSYDNKSFSNVLSSFGPDTREVIIVGAHYDAFATLPGADDNASGVAGLLELARALSVTPVETNILLIAYACEESPYFAGPGMGSYIHANSVRDRDVQLMISLEMIGYYTKSPDSQSFPFSALSLLYPKQGNFIAVVGETLDTQASKLKSTINANTSLEAYSINAPASIRGIDFSDHRNYWSLNMPAVMVTDTAFYRNMNYHTDTDTYDTLDYEKMKEVVYGVYLHIVDLAKKN